MGMKALLHIHDRRLSFLGRFLFFFSIVKAYTIWVGIFEVHCVAPVRLLGWARSIRRMVLFR